VAQFIAFSPGQTLDYGRATSDEFIQMVRRASVSIGVDGLEQILKAPGITRSINDLPESEPAVLAHLVSCGELQHARPAAGAGISSSAPSQAEAECRAAVEISPPSVFLLMALGFALEKSKPEAAIAVFRQAIALKPELSEPHLLLADTLTSKAGDRNAGVREALDALRLDPNNPDAFLFFVGPGSLLPPATNDHQICY
jgi:tetratricopeptide (TPR) repeat protein